MRFGVATASAVEALISNPMRSLLTMLGIIIGVASVMVMMSIGEGARAQIDAQISSIGTNLLTLQPGSIQRGGRQMGMGGARPFSETDVTAVADLPFVEAATGVLNGNVTAVSETGNWVTNIQGGNADYFKVNNWHASDGREFTAQESQSGSALVVLGTTVAKNLFPAASSNSEVIGQRIRINSVPVEIIGVLESKGQVGGGQDRDDTIVAPVTMVRNRVTGGNRWVARHVNRIQFLVRDGYDIAQAQDETSTLMRERRRIQAGATDNFTVINFADIIKQRAATTNTMSMLLAFTAAVTHPLADKVVPKINKFISFLYLSSLRQSHILQSTRRQFYFKFFILNFFVMAAVHLSAHKAANFFNFFNFLIFNVLIFFKFDLFFLD